jgi:hypothetical protein
MTGCSPYATGAALTARGPRGNDREGGVVSSIETAVSDTVERILEEKLTEVVAVLRSEQPLALNYREAGVLLGVCDRTVAKYVEVGLLHLLPGLGSATRRIARVEIEELVTAHLESPPASGDRGRGPGLRPAS